MAIEEDRADVERIAVSWQDVNEVEQQGMIAGLSDMLDRLDADNDAERQLRLDAGRMIGKIESSLGPDARTDGQE